MKIAPITLQIWRPRFIRWLALGVVFLGLACSKSDNPMEPAAPQLSSFALTVMGTVDAGQPIDLQIEAVGSDGSRPYTAFNGPVTLSADRGTVTPNEVTLTAGTAITTITLSVADGAVNLTATNGTVLGAATINLTALSILPGAPGDPVEGAIPDLAFEPRGVDYDTNHPDIPGIPISYNTMGIVFELGTTVGDANAILTTLGATIAGGIPGVVGQAPGILMIRTNSTSHTTMTQYLQQLEANALVQVATEDWMTVTQEQPKPNGGTPNDWNWEVTPTGGNWGLELTRMPAVWNLNPTIERYTTPTIRMGIIDNGMTAHTDFPSFIDLTPAQVGDHGMHVAGIMGAKYDNGLGVDGVNPYAEFVTVSKDTFTILWETYALTEIMKQAPQTKVVNISLGIHWSSGTVNPGGNTRSQQSLTQKGALVVTTLIGLRTKGSAPLICVAAGNDSNSGLGLVDAIYESGWTNAALEWLVPEVIVVENVQRDGGSPGGASRAASSNIGGHISAPGTDILSTVRGSYGVKSGTSMASPFVAGFIGYLYALEPTLTQEEIKNLLLDTATPVGGGAADRIDAADAVLALDAIHGPDEILRRFVDIDDGSVDGNQRAFFGNPGVDFLDEDADGNGGPGDGQVDMSDFRRWRDWLLQAEDVTFWELDGTTRHPKRDVNGNGEVEVPDDENKWPRGDFNLDGILSRTATSKMPGAMGDVEATDLEVLQFLFEDPDVDKADLPGLIESGDIHVDLADFLGQQGVTEARIQVMDGITRAPITDRTVTTNGDTPVFTVATGLTLYAVKVEGLDGTGSTICTFENDFELAPGKDIYLKPECTSVAVELQMAQFLEPGTPSPLLIRAGIKSGGGVNYQAGLQIEITATGSSVAPAMGVTDAGGNFNSEVTLNEGTEQTTVFVTATDPTSGQSATSSASARALPEAPHSEFRNSYFALIVQADAGSKHDDSVVSLRDVQFFQNGASASTSNSCPQNPAIVSEATASSQTDFAIQNDLFSGYMKGIFFSGSEEISAMNMDDGAGPCGPDFLFAKGDLDAEIDFRLFEEPAILDLDIQYQTNDLLYAGGIEIFESDSLGLNKQRIYLNDFIHGEVSGEVNIVASIELRADKFYEIYVDAQLGGRVSGGTEGSFESTLSYTGEIRLRKVPANRVRLSSATR